MKFDVIFEMVLPRRPVSYNARGRPGFAAWKDFVRDEARKIWTAQPLIGEDYYFQIIYIYSQNPVDIDNIVKPIQDALVDIVFSDDVNISDVSAHRRLADDKISPEDFPEVFQAQLEVLTVGTEMVYMRLCQPKGIGDFL